MAINQLTFVVENASFLHGQMRTVDRPNNTADHCVESLMVKALGSDCVEQVSAENAN